MIRVTVGSTLSRQTVMVNEETTVRSILEENHIDYSRGMTTLDGSQLGIGDMDKTLPQLGITERCVLMNVVKADNA